MSQIVTTAKHIWRSHGPEIMTGLTIVGVGASIFSTARSSIKAVELIREAETELQWDTIESGNPRERYSNLERLKIIWPVLITPALLTTATIGCILLTRRVDSNRTAAATAAFTMAERAFNEYKDAVVEKHGTEFAEGIKEEVVNRTVAKEPHPEPGHVFPTGNGMTLMKDSVSGRYFYSSVDAVKRAETEINRRLYLEGMMSLSEFYNLIDLDETNISDNLGWTDQNPLDISYTTYLTVDDKPCVYVYYQVKPFSAIHSQ